MINFNPTLQQFLTELGKGQIEIYNEFSLQHEMGIFLRKAVGTGFKVQFERPVSYFGLDRGLMELEKRK